MKVQNQPVVLAVNVFLQTADPSVRVTVYLTSTSVSIRNTSMSHVIILPDVFLHFDEHRHCSLT